MSGRRGRSRTRASNINRRHQRSPSDHGDRTDNVRSRSPRNRRPQTLDESLPANWTTSRLKQELRKDGIDLPGSQPHKLLLKLYEQLQNKRSAEVHSINSQEVEIPSENPASREPEMNYNVQDGGAHVLESFRSEMRAVQGNLAQIMRRLDDKEDNNI